MNLGYACINMTLGSRKPKITTNRSMVRKTFLERGLDYAGELGLENSRDLIHILVVQNTIIDLELHGKIFDLMGLEKSPYNNINIHCNGVYGDKKSAMDRFILNFQRLSPSVQTRLTVENDDKESMYSVKDLMYIHEKTGIPIVFDYHHHKFCTGGLSEEQALKLAVSTWPKGITPEVHYSESKSLHENNIKIKPQAHSDYINALPNTYELDLDIMVESKAKELAILPFLN